MNPRVLLFVPVYNCVNQIDKVIENISTKIYIDRVIFIDNGSIIFHFLFVISYFEHLEDGSVIHCHASIIYIVKDYYNLLHLFH